MDGSGVKEKERWAVHDLVRNAGWPFQNASAKPDTLSKTKRRSNWWNQRKKEIKKMSLQLLILYVYESEKGRYCIVQFEPTYMNRQFPHFGLNTHQSPSPFCCQSGRGGVVRLPRSKQQ